MWLQTNGGSQRFCRKHLYAYCYLQLILCVGTVSLIVKELIESTFTIYGGES
jgi:hypothetical protein